MPRDIENGRRLRREHYYRNRDYYKEKAYARTQRVKLEIRIWIAEYLLKHPCIDCSETDLVVLDFDHRDPNDKIFNIGDAITMSKGMKSIIAEVDKCDVRCANCHKRRTAKQFGWWRSGYESQLPAANDG